MKSEHKAALWAGAASAIVGFLVITMERQNAVAVAVACMEENHVLRNCSPSDEGMGFWTGVAILGGLGWCAALFSYTFAEQDANEAERKRRIESK